MIIVLGIVLVSSVGLVVGAILVRRLTHGRWIWREFE
jgi:hypothetical protein